jgi:hypothetical protein
VQAALAEFECVEWQYDGLEGEVIKWTQEHGNDNDDPAEMIWALDSGAGEIGRPTSGQLNDAAELVAWLGDMKEDHDKLTGKIPPEMTVMFDAAIVRNPGKDEGSAAILEGLKSAERNKMAVFGYVSVPDAKKDDKEWKAERKQCDKLEHGALADEELTKLAGRCFAIRFDLTDPKIAKYLDDAWKIKKAPTLFVIDWTKKDPKPRTWTNAAVKGKEIADALRKILPKE